MQINRNSVAKALLIGVLLTGGGGPVGAQSGPTPAGTPGNGSPYTVETPSPIQIHGPGQNPTGLRGEPTPNQ